MPYTPKWLKWEFWPSSLFYLPIYAKYLFYYSIRARTLGFFSAVNPFMEFGGMTTYSKYDVLKNINDAYLPKMRLLSPPFSFRSIEEMGFTYPVILKPDKGERGTGVQKIKDFNAYKSYLKKTKEAIILQECIEYPLEYGVMYYRYPSEKKGVVSSLVRKEVLFVIGDGFSSLKEFCLLYTSPSPRDA